MTEKKRKKAKKNENDRIKTKKSEKKRKSPKKNEKKRKKTKTITSRELLLYPKNLITFTYFLHKIKSQSYI
jgi:hypothetical protein